MARQGLEAYLSGTPAAPPTSVVAPEGSAPFAFLVARQARQSARADHLGIRRNPPPAAPAPQPRGSSSPDALPYKGPPGSALPPPNFPAPAQEEEHHIIKYKGPPGLVLPRPTFGLQAPYKGPPSVLREPTPPPALLRVSEAPASTEGGPPDMRSRSQAVQTQIEELWRLNQMCGTDFDHLANAVKHAYGRDYISTSERDRLDVVNKAGNDAKHKGLGSRSRSVTPVRSAARASSCSPAPGRRGAGARFHSPPAVARASSRALSSTDPAPLPPPWGPGESRPASGWV